MLKFKFWTRKTDNLREIVPLVVRSGYQMVTSNLREQSTSNPPIAKTYCIQTAENHMPIGNFILIFIK